MVHLFSIKMLLITCLSASVSLLGCDDKKGTSKKPLQSSTVTTLSPKDGPGSNTSSETKDNKKKPGSPKESTEESGEEGGSENEQSQEEEPGTFEFSFMPSQLVGPKNYPTDKTNPIPDEAKAKTGDYTPDLSKIGIKQLKVHKNNLGVLDRPYQEGTFTEIASLETKSGCKFVLILGDITKIPGNSKCINVYVNAANNGLAGGGGVDRAFGSAGGKEIYGDCRRYKQVRNIQGDVLAGSVVLGDPCKLRAIGADYIAHAVGPTDSGSIDTFHTVYRNLFYKSNILGIENNRDVCLTCVLISSGIFGRKPEESVCVCWDEFTRQCSNPDNKIPDNRIKECRVVCIDVDNTGKSKNTQETMKGAYEGLRSLIISLGGTIEEV